MKQLIGVAIIAATLYVFVRSFWFDITPTDPPSGGGMAGA